MHSFTYWPYDEVSLDTHVADGQIKLKTPWLEAFTKREFFDDEKLLSLSHKLADRSLTVDDLGMVNEFFRHFHQYPIAYILPTPKEGALDRHSLVDESLLVGSIEEVLARIFYENDQFAPAAENETISVLKRNEWAWDNEAALSFATIGHDIHPESLFSIARRFHLLELLNSDDGIKIFQEIKKLAPNEFKKAVTRLVRQNHYVTEKCQESLLPAVSLAQQARGLVEDFMKEERGHDKLLKKALNELGETPENIKVTKQTKGLMQVLKFAAQRNFLAFSMAIDAFERSNFDDTDPIARLLIVGGFDKAAHYLNAHMNINDHGNHDNVAKKFLRYMAPCDRNYAKEALRLMEVISLLMSAISQSACFYRD